MALTIQETLYCYPPSAEHHVHEPSLLFSEMNEYKTNSALRNWNVDYPTIIA